MEIKGKGSIEQLDKSKTPYRCKAWRLWVLTSQGRKSKRFNGNLTEARAELANFILELKNTDECTSEAKWTNEIQAKYNTAKENATEILIDSIWNVLKERKMTQFQLSQMTNISTSSINGYLKGKNIPNFDQAVKICNALNISIDAMYDCSFNEKELFLKYKNADLQDIARIYHSINIEGKHHLKAIAKSISYNPEFMINKTNNLF